MAASVAPPPPLPSPPASPFDPPRKASLYVGDLDPEVTETELMETFREMGPLLSVRLCRDRLSQKSLRYAYINFFSPPDASKALACLNHKELKGKPMRIMWCQRDPLTRKTGIANLFIKNLDPSVTSARLQDIFCKFGTILSCKVAEENGKSKGFGFVQFDLEDSAMAALDAVHGTMLEGKKLYVSKFVKKSERKDAQEAKYTNLYVKNLCEDVTEDLLRDKFSEFGKVCNVMIMKDAEGKSRGFGFVDFESHEEAKKAVQALNGALLGLEKLFVGKAQKKAEREELLKREYKEMLNRFSEKSKASNLYVKNLDVSVDDRKLQEHFSAFGKVTSAKVMCHDNGISKGFGFVSFSTPEEAKKALDTVHGTLFQGRSLFVAVAQRKEERCRQLQTCYAQYPLQSFFSSNWDILTPPIHPPHYNFPLCPLPNPVSHQPIMSQHLDRNASAQYPFAAQGNISTYIPMRQSQQGTSMDYVYQHSMGGYAISNVPIQEPNYGRCKDQKPSRKMGNKKSAAAEASSKGSAATRGLIAVSSLGNCKKTIGELLYPRVENLQPGCAAKITGMLLEMNKSDILELLNSPKSLAVQVEKAVRVLEVANSRTGADGVGLPVKSVRCLSY
uniref:Polyadenylate-binding protein n=1 Tax=Davidia involucrata TaxID=16924 RepID=A0A5B7BD69_DAVIN